MDDDPSRSAQFACLMQPERTPNDFYTQANRTSLRRYGMVLHIL